MKPNYASKVVWLAFVPIGGAVLFSLAIALIVRSQLATMAQEEPAMPDADRDVLDSLEPLREGDGDRRHDANGR